MAEEKKVTITLNIDKIKKYLKYAGIILAIVILLLPLILMFFPKNNIVIKLKDGEMYRGRAVILTDDNLYCWKSENSYKELDIAYSDTDEIEYNLSMIETEKIDSIYYIIESASNEEDLDNENKEQKFDSSYLGNYKVKVSGHVGYLYIRYKNNYLYGGLKFPDWANGVYEPLKSLRIKNGYISFTRSATTVKELRRIGASSYYTQKFSGRFYKNGKIIKGFFYNSGSKQSWEAEKL